MNITGDVYGLVDLLLALIYNEAAIIVDQIIGAGDKLFFIIRNYANKRQVTCMIVQCANRKHRTRMFQYFKLPSYLV